jgi:hypothetical protein
VPLPHAGPAIEPKEYKRDEMPEKSVKTFADVLGCDESKAELQVGYELNEWGRGQCGGGGGLNRDVSFPWGVSFPMSHWTCTVAGRGCCFIGRYLAFHWT